MGIVGNLKDKFRDGFDISNNFNKYIEEQLGITDLQFYFYLFDHRPQDQRGWQTKLVTELIPFGTRSWFHKTERRVRSVFKSDIGVLFWKNNKAYGMSISAHKVYYIAINQFDCRVGLFGGYHIWKQEFELDRDKVLRILQREVSNINTGSQVIRESDDGFKSQSSLG